MAGSTDDLSLLELKVLNIQPKVVQLRVLGKVLVPGERRILETDPILLDGSGLAGDLSIDERSIVEESFESSQSSLRLDPELLDVKAAYARGGSAWKLTPSSLSSWRT